MASVDPNAAAPANALDITKQQMVGNWRVANGGSSCDMFLTLTNLGSGSRGGTRGCAGELTAMGSWEVAGKQVVLIPWQVYPSMQVNGAFAEHLRKAGLSPESKLYFICRSGVRSLAAGQAAQAAGFPLAYNVAGGFEGPVDAEGHRGQVAGWKADGLPWLQR